MRTIVRSLVAGALAAVCCAAQETTRAGFADDVREVFAWLDVIDPLDTSKLAYGRVAVDDSGSSHVRGFLLEDRGGTFVLRGIDLERHVFRKRSPGSKEGVEIEPRDLSVDARAIASQLRASASWGLRGYFHPGDTVGPLPAAVLMARACARRGFDVEARELCDAVRSRKSSQASDEAHSLRAFVEGELTDSCWWQSVCASVDRTRTRPELLSGVRAYLTHFPDSRHGEHARRLAAGLESLIAEDAARARAPVESRTADSDVESWIYGLRDQVEPVNPSWIDAWELEAAESRPFDATSAGRLVSAGRRAVPALLAASTDSRPSRCVQYYSRFGGDASNLSIGRLATDALEKIFGRSFREGGIEAHSELVSAGKEREALAWCVRSGGADAVAAAETLVARYPESALDAIARGARAANSWDRENLVGIAARLPGDEPVAFLLEELSAAPPGGHRVAAAFALRARGRKEALGAMIQAWVAFHASGAKVDPFFGDPYRDEMLRFLISTGSEAGMRAIANGPWEQGPGAMRRALLEAVDQWPRQPPKDAAAAEDWRKSATILEEILVRGLDDDRVIHGTTYRDCDGVILELANHRCADECAWALAALFRDRYVFHGRATLRVRDRDLVVSRNVWRAAHGEPLLPLPPGPKRAASPKAVCEGKFRDDSGRAPAMLAERVAALEGQPLTADGVVALFLLGVNETIATGGGVRLDVERSGDGSGLSLALRILGNEQVRNRSGCDHSSSFRIGGKSLPGGWGTGVDGVWREASDFEDEKCSIRAVLDGAPDEVGEIQLERLVR